MRRENGPRCREQVGPHFADARCHPQRAERRGEHLGRQVLGVHPVTDFANMSPRHQIGNRLHPVGRPRPAAVTADRPIVRVRLAGRLLAGDQVEAERPAAADYASPNRV